MIEEIVKFVYLGNIFNDGGAVDDVLNRILLADLTFGLIAQYLIVFSVEKVEVENLVDLVLLGNRLL